MNPIIHKEQNPYRIESVAFRVCTIILLFILVAAHIGLAGQIRGLRARIIELESKQIIQTSFMNNQWRVDQDQDERYNELVKGLYPDEEKTD